jgi:two-component system, chemotaxis family, chemotaxis protein CheY
MAKIVVIDDSLYMRSILKHLLTKGGHTVIGEADSYEQALSILEKELPDLITLDIILKDHTGLDLLKQIRKRFPSVLVIMVSAVGEEFVVEEAMELGALDYIVKPFNEQNVAETVNRICASYKIS